MDIGRGGEGAVEGMWLERVYREEGGASGRAPSIHDEGAGGGYAAAEAEEGLQHVADVGAAVLATTSSVEASDIVISLSKRNKDLLRRA
jgi:hypothetical protein